MKLLSFCKSWAKLVVDLPAPEEGPMILNPPKYSGFDVAYHAPLFDQVAMASSFNYTSLHPTEIRLLVLDVGQD